MLGIELGEGGENITMLLEQPVLLLTDRRSVSIWIEIYHLVYILWISLGMLRTPMILFLLVARRWIIFFTVLIRHLVLVAIDEVGLDDCKIHRSKCLTL